MWILYLIPICGFQWLTVSAAVIAGPDIKPVPPICEGKSVLLLCSATCTNGSCQYSWTGYGYNTPVIASSLNIVNVNRTYHNKEYTCTVKDMDNVPKTGKSTLEVHYGPDSVTVKSGSPVTKVEGTLSDSLDLVCEASASNPLFSKFEWTLTGTVISNASKLFPTNKKILRNDTGTYTCKATNCNGEAKTTSVTLDVQYPPDVDLKWDSATNALTCKATGNPTTYTFVPIEQYVERTLVRTYDPKKSQDTASVSLGTVDYQDTGRYECYVSNTIKNRSKAEIKIQAKDSPVLAASETSYNVSKGANFPVMISLYSYPPVNEVSISDHNMTLGCKSVGDVISLTCVLQSMPIPFHGKNVTISGHKLTLTFHKILEEDFKTHTIIMSNGVGKIETNVTFLPQGPPDTPTSFKKAESSHESMTFTLVTGFYNGGSQTIVVEHKLAGNQSSWYNESKEYAGEDKSVTVTVVVEGLSAETLYEFRAFAYNEYDRSMYTDILQAETNKAPPSVGVIVGSVVGGLVVLCIIVVVVVILVIKYRRKKKEPDAAQTYMNQNKDLTLEMPTTPGIQSDRVKNVYVKEPVTPESPSQTILYENMMLNTGKNTFQDHTKHTGNYDVPPSRDHYVNSFNQFGNTVTPYDVPRLQTPQRVGLYDSPRSQGAVGSTSKDDSEGAGTMPPYLDLNNPEPVEEAYLDVSKSKMLVDQSKAKPKLTKQDTETEEEYLDMNVLSGSAVKSDKRSKSKESPYCDMSDSKPYENTDFSSKKKGKKEKDEKDYQNVAQYQKIKVALGGKHGKKKKDKKEAEIKDYQNVAKYKKKPQHQPSEDSQSDYMSMEADSKRKSAMSIPDYNAPPPPPDAVPEEDYMNMRLAYSKR